MEYEHLSIVMAAGHRSPFSGYERNDGIYAISADKKVFKHLAQVYPIMHQKYKARQTPELRQMALLFLLPAIQSSNAVTHVLRRLITTVTSLAIEYIS